MTGEELREARLDLGLSQTELAAAIGLRTQSHVSMMERGKKAVSARTAINVAALLKAEKPREITPGG